MSQATEYAEAVARNPAPVPFQFSGPNKPGYLRAWVNTDGDLCITQPGTSPPQAAQGLAIWLGMVYGVVVKIEEVPG